MDPLTRSGHGRRRGLLRALGLLIVGLALAWLVRGIEWRALGHELRGARLGLVAVAALLGLLNMFLKAQCWRALLTPFARLPSLAMVRYTLAASAGSALAPARAGELVRMWLLHERHQVPMTASGAVMALEKTGDVLLMLLLVAPVPWLMPQLGPWTARSIHLLTAAVVGAVVLLWLMRRAPRLRQARCLAGFRLVSQPRVLALGLAAVAAAWLVDVAEVLLVFAAMHIQAPAVASLLVLLGVNMAIAIPAAPANAGSHELGAVAALSLFGISHDSALAFALVYHWMQVIPVVVLGLLDGRRLMPSLQTASSTAPSAPPRSSATTSVRGT